MEKISTFWFVQGLIGRLAQRGVAGFDAHPLLKSARAPNYGGYEGTSAISRDSQRRENGDMSGYEDPGARDDNEHAIDRDVLQDAEEVNPAQLHRRHMLLESLKAQGMDISEAMEKRMLSGLDEQSRDSDGDADVNEMTDEAEDTRDELSLSGDTELSERGVVTDNDPVGDYEGSGAGGSGGGGGGPG